MIENNFPFVNLQRITSQVNKLIKDQSPRKISQKDETNSINSKFRNLKNANIKKMKKIFVNNVGDLAEIQRASFYRFLSKGISEELRNFPNPFLGKLSKPYKKKDKFRIRFDSPMIYHYAHQIKLKGPNVSVMNALENDQTYSIRFYVPSEYYSSSIENHKGEIFSSNGEEDSQTLVKYVHIKQDIFFGEIPLMTEEGTFVVSGCERVIISQIIRSPGIYFKKEFGTSRKAVYTSTIISRYGLWTKFILGVESEEKKQKLDEIEEERKDEIYIQLSEYKPLDSDFDDEDDEDESRKKKLDLDKLFLFDLIRYFGLTYEEIFDSLKYPLLLSNQKLTRVKREEQEISLLIRKLFSAGHSSCFSIGEIGRYKINKKLGINLPKHITYLTAQDFIGIVDGLMELKYYDRASDDIDDIKNKQIRSIGELLQNQMRIGCYRLRKNLLESGENFDFEEVDIELESEEDAYNWLLDPRPITSALKEFFKTSQLSQFMDQINPLSDLTHKRRISVFGPNGLKRDNISTGIRDIHPSQYGRLCPVETPEGQNAGLISSIAMFARMDSLGSLETPYFLIKNSKVFSNRRPIFLNPEQESTIEIGFSDIFFRKGKEEKIFQDYLSIKSKNLFSVRKKSQINFLTTSPLQIISLATSLIPFLEHDDANRALMGSNMQRQAVPLLYPQKAIVGTGQEVAAILDSGMVVKSYCEGTVFLSNLNAITIKDHSEQKIHYILKKYWRSNQETTINQRPVVWPGEKVFSGQIIADGPSTLDGELSLGRNLTIAYMPWEGYNYEDAIVINERLIIEDCLTSVHVEEYETNISSSLYGNDKLTNNIPFLSSYIQRNLDENGIIKLGSYVKEQDVLVGKLTPCEEDKSPAAKLIEALFGKKKEYNRDTSLKVPPGTEGRIIGIKILRSKLSISEVNRKKLVSRIPINAFFGICKSTEETEKKDEVKEILQQFSNVIAESNDEIKNLRNSLETKNLRLTQSSNATKLLKKAKAEKKEQISESSFQTEYIFSLEKTNQNQPVIDKSTVEFSSYTIQISIAQIRKIKVGDKLAGRHGNKGVISRILPKQDMPYLPNGMPIDIIFNPLGVPSRMNVGQVFECLLGIAGEKLGNRYKISPFDETYGKEASRVLVNQKLKQASKQQIDKWILNANYPGKVLLRDGRTGEFFDNPITIGKTYILKLIHLVEDKIHSRATGPYSMITEQPLAGKSQKGGQRFGEMEVWALEAYGCCNTLQELLTIKSDDIDGRNDMYESLLIRKQMPKPSPSIPEAFLALIRELNALGLCFTFRKVKSNFHSREKFSQVDKEIFEDVENRLKLRDILTRKRAQASLVLNGFL